MAFPDNGIRNRRHHHCFICIKAVKWIPVLFIVMIILWSYYAYIYELCILTIRDLSKKIIYAILYHVTLFMFCWAYWKTVFTRIATVPEKFKLTEMDYDRLMRAESEDIQHQILEASLKDLPNVNRTANGGARFCEKCHHIKPDRAHHCSVCGECVLKMDHHCPWVNNCVGFTNYKFFMLFLGYSLIYCIYICLTSLQYIIDFWQKELNGVGKFHILFLFFVALIVAISLISLFVYHCYLVYHNRTTLEAFRPPIFEIGPDKNGFSLGACNNFKQIFGDDSKFWFLPVNSSCGDGLSFSVPSRHHPSTYHSMDARDTRLA